ncbi:MAG: fatty acid desaturase [Nitratireductor sp.]
MRIVSLLTDAHFVHILVMKLHGALMKKGFFNSVEWPTVLLIGFVYVAWLVLALRGEHLNPLLWISLVALLTTLYWSIVHEVVHCHPTRNAFVNYTLVYLPLGWVYALGRFGDGHLQHHATGDLTDPFDDPESWYLAQRDWNSLSPLSKGLLTINNTLAGRMIIGPIITLWRMVAGDAMLIRKGGQAGRRVAIAWLIHVPALLLLAGLLIHYSHVPAWQFVAAAYLGISVLLIRTFLEHQASASQGARTVLIEDNGILAFLFLYNNLHIVHHTRPGLAWYRLPGFYKRHRANFHRRNNGYVYASYWEIFRRYFLVAKEPVAHPTVI